MFCGNWVSFKRRYFFLKNFFGNFGISRTCEENFDPRSFDKIFPGFCKAFGSDCLCIFNIAVAFYAERFVFKNKSESFSDCINPFVVKVAFDGIDKELSFKFKVNFREVSVFVKIRFKNDIGKMTLNGESNSSGTTKISL